MLIDIDQVSSIVGVGPSSTATSSSGIYQGLASNIYVYNLTTTSSSSAETGAASVVARISEYYRITPAVAKDTEEEEEEDSSSGSAAIVKPYALWSRDFGLVITTNVTVQLERRKNLGGTSRRLLVNQCII